MHLFSTFSTYDTLCLGFCLFIIIFVSFPVKTTNPKTQGVDFTTQPLNNILMFSMASPLGKDGRWINPVN